MAENEKTAQNIPESPTPETAGGREEKSKKQTHGAGKKRREENAEKRRAQRAEREAEKSREAAEKRAAKEARQQLRRERAERRRAQWKRFLHRLKIFCIVVAIVAVILAAAATVGGYYVTNSNVNLPNVYLDGVDVSGLTKGQTMVRLGEAGWDENAEIPLTVMLPADVSFELDMYESGAMLPRETAAEAAFRYGHGDNWYENLLRYIKGLVVQTDVSQKFTTLNEDYIREKVERAIAGFQAATADEGYVIDKEKEELRLVKGAGAMEIDKAVLTDEIVTALRTEQKEVDHRHIDNELVLPDFDALYKELHVEPVDACYTDEKFNVQDEVVGCGFDVEAARELWTAAAPGDTVRIPLQIDYPQVTGEQLRGQLFRDCLGKQTTLFGGSTAERMNNIRLAASKLNGVIVYPGETFSYNATVGQRTKEAGFQEAGAYQDGEVVQEIGGGVCQVSSTLYCAALYANMETVEREAHYFMVNYLPRAHDATVSWPSPDYKFKNTRDYPVMIRAWADTEEALDLTVEIWGTDVDGSYVELKYDSYMIFDEEYTDIVVGWHVYSHREVYDKDGNLIATVDEPDGIYHKHNEDIPWPDGRNG